MEQRPKRLTSAKYTVTRCTRQGRLTSRQPFRDLGWPAGQKISIGSTGGCMVIHAKSDGKDTIGPKGFLLLPAAIRRHFAFNNNEPLFVASYPDRDLVLICTPAVLDEMTLARFRFLQ